MFAIRFILSGDKSLEWGCSKCRGEEFSSGDELTQIRGCNGKDIESLGFAFAPSLRQCPWSQISSETWELINWWLSWSTLRTLPWGGQDIMQQPAIVLEVLELCETAKKECEAKAQKQQFEELRQARKRAGNGR